MEREVKEVGLAWVFTYRDNNFEIRKNTQTSYRPNLSGFTYYIFSKDIDGCPREIADKFEVGDFHCGITYSKRITEESFKNPENEPWRMPVSYLKFGCDYAHLYDDGRETLESVKWDAMRTIDKLIEAGLLEERKKGE